jgi:hypothetical protein
MLYALSFPRESGEWHYDSSRQSQRLEASIESKRGERHERLVAMVVVAAFTQLVFIQSNPWTQQYQNSLGSAGVVGVGSMSTVNYFTWKAIWILHYPPPANGPVALSPESPTQFNGTVEMCFAVGMSGRQVVQTGWYE